MNEQGKIRVAVVFGGRGPEHAISCASGGTMLATIDRDRYEVIPIGILPDGRWVLTADEPERLAITGGQLPSVEAVAGPGGQVRPWGAGGQGALTTAEPGAIPRELGEVDLVLPVLHGPYGEDGTLQGLLEMAGIRYVGAGVLASAVSMDKEYMKLIFKAKGLPVGPFVVVRDQDWQPAADSASVSPSVAAERKRVLDAIAELGWPVFVKPARGGSSIGTSKAADVGELHGPSRTPASTTARCWSSGPSPGTRWSAPCWRGSTAGRRTPACRASSWWKAARNSSTSRPSTWMTRTGWRSPRRSRPAPGGGPPAGRGRVRGGVR